MQAPFAQGTAGIENAYRAELEEGPTFFKKDTSPEWTHKRSPPRAPIAFFSLLIYVDPLSGEHILVKKTGREGGVLACPFKLRLAFLNK
jgi:hypothetical protein